MTNDNTYTDAQVPIASAEIFKSSSLELESDVPFVEDEVKSSETKWEKIKKHQLKIALGSYAVSLAIGIGSSAGHLEENAIEALPVAGGVYLASEIAWIGGMALCLAGAGSKIRNPLKIKQQWNEIKNEVSDNRKVRSGLLISGAGALGIEAAIVSGAVASDMPTETWAVLAPDIALGVTSTIWARKALLDRMKANRQNRANEVNDAEPNTTQLNTTEKEAKPIVSVRRARPEDAVRLAEIGKVRYRRVIAETESQHSDEEADQEAIEMFRKRLENTTPQWMLVCEVDGQVEGSVTAFRTNKPMEEFVSWEDTTSNGTLDDRVDPEGKYAYVVNLTVNPKATNHGALEIMMAKLMAEAIKEGLEYGYFISRMPLFSSWLKRWAKRNGTDASKLSQEQIDHLAQDYVDLKEVVDGKEVRTDYELRMYEQFGFEIGPLVKDAYKDPMSLDYGVLFKAPIPPSGGLKKIKPVRHAMAATLSKAAEHPKILEKIL